MSLQINLPEKIAKIFEPKARYRVAYGGRGSGKSMGFARMMILESLKHPKKKFLCCREVQNSIHDSVHAMIKQQIYEMGLEEYFDIGLNYIRTTAGAEFVYKGLLRNSSEIKSMQGVQIAWVEEAQSVSHKSLDYLLPTIREKGSEIWFTYNPEDELDPVHDTFVTKQRRNAVVEKVNYYDNPFFPEELENERLDDYDNKPKKYDWIWLGQFNVDPDGSVYAQWLQKAESEGRVKQDLFDPELPVHTAWDLGWGDATTIWFYQVSGNEVWFIDYFEDNNEDIKFYCEQLAGKEIIVEEYGEHGVPLKWHYGEPIEGATHRADYTYGTHSMPHDAGNKLQAAGGRSLAVQAGDYGLDVDIIPATSQKNQIAIGRKTLDHAWFDGERCKDGIRALRKYKFEFDDTRGIYKKEPLHDWASHGCDAFEIAGQVWRTPKQPKIKQPPKFLEQKTIDELWQESGHAENTRI